MYRLQPAVPGAATDRELRVGQQITTRSSLAIEPPIAGGDTKTDRIMTTTGTGSIICTETAITGCFTGSYIPNITLGYGTIGETLTEYTTLTHTTDAGMSL